MKTLTGILIDVKNQTAQVTTIPDTLDGYYEALDCDCIDIVSRKVGERYFEIIADDEGLLKDDIKVSGINSKGCVMLVGNIFVCKENGHGDLKSLTDEECQYVMKHVGMISMTDEFHLYPALCYMDY